MPDYVNKHWYVTSKASVMLQHHLSINLDLSNPIKLDIRGGGSDGWQGVYMSGFFVSPLKKTRPSLMQYPSADRPL